MLGGGGGGGGVSQHLISKIERIKDRLMFNYNREKNVVMRGVASLNSMTLCSLSPHVDQLL